MSLFSLVGLYEGLLLHGSFRGAPFTYVSSEDEPGRRVVEFLFPGQDIKSYQDLGQDDGEIVVSGILVGDDYTAQAEALRTALQTPGPGTLVHPWLGSVEVVQKPGRLPKLSFKTEALRVCTFTATFVRYKPRDQPGPYTLQGLFNAFSALKADALGLLTTILAPVALVLGVVSQVEAMAGQIGSIFGGLLPHASRPEVATAASTPLLLLAEVAQAPLDGTYAGTVGALLAGPSAAIAATSTPLVPAAVAPGGSVVTPIAVDGRVTADLLLTAAAQLGVVKLSGLPIQIAPGPALILLAQVFMIADAADAADGIGFDSQQEAVIWRDRITAAIDAATLAAARLVPSSAASAAVLWRGLIALRAAWIAELNSIIGNLPPVVTFTPPAAAPVWVMAQFLAGDDPARVIATYRDLIARNGIYHPGTPPPGPLEVLR